MDLALAAGGRYYDVEELANPGSAISKILEYERKKI